MAYMCRVGLALIKIPYYKQTHTLGFVYTRVCVACMNSHARVIDVNNQKWAAGV